MKNYWLHRIKHEWYIAKPLLDKGYLTIGWQGLMARSQRLRKCIAEKHGEGFELLMNELNETSRSRWCLKRFSTFKPGDIVVVPLNNHKFAIVEVIESAKSILDLPIEIVNELDNFNLSVDGLYDAKNNRTIDIGFFVKVKTPVKVIPRSYAEDILQKKMSTIGPTNTPIDGLASAIIKADQSEVPIEVHEVTEERTGNVNLYRVHLKTSTMPNEIEKKLISLYDEIGLGTCDICKKCKTDNPGLYSKAVGCWFVGNEFSNQAKRILFVGKNARGIPAHDYEENQNDKGFLEEFRYTRDILWNKGWAYWSYTREICKELFGSLGVEAVAFTNMIKCNGSDSIDTTTDSTKDYCIHELGVIKREIEVIKPTHIICYIGDSYNHWLIDLFDKLECMKSTKIPVGKKEITFADFDAVLQGRKIKVLKIAHPERKKKNAYISAVVNWINNN